MHSGLSKNILKNTSLAFFGYILASGILQENWKEVPGIVRDYRQTKTTAEGLEQSTPSAQLSEFSSTVPLLSTLLPSGSTAPLGLIEQVKNAPVEILGRVFPCRISCLAASPGQSSKPQQNSSTPQHQLLGKLFWTV